MAESSPAPRQPMAAWWLACALDVAVRKPGNVSVHSEGHRMQAAHFLDSASAAAAPISRQGASVGARIEGAIAATWDAVGCNTNLGIVLLAAPLLAAADTLPARSMGGWAPRLEQLHAATAEVLERLTQDDAAAAFTAIARAQPAGLGQADAADVRAPAQVTLLEAMRLAAGRDRIARQYANRYDEVFERVRRDWSELLLPPASGDWWPGWPRQGSHQSPPALHAPHELPAVPAPTERALQTSFLHWLASAPDTHIERKHGTRPAQAVSAQAGEWLAQGGPPAGDARRDAAWQAWDAELKQAGLNPGTSADLSVACALVAALVS